ncbi:MAG: Ig-like domain-containing protein, partial [Oscillospiraceae bacterium]|nr:Ig-like domain-containing protein [Oscillospiraceae bacterium]
MKKRLFSLLIALVMLISLLPMSALAADSETDKALTDSEAEAGAENGDNAIAAVADTYVYTYGLLDGCDYILAYDNGDGYDVLANIDGALTVKTLPELTGDFVDENMLWTVSGKNDYAIENGGMHLTAESGSIALTGKHVDVWYYDALNGYLYYTTPSETYLLTFASGIAFAYEGDYYAADGRAVFYAAEGEEIEFQPSAAAADSYAESPVKSDRSVGTTTILAFSSDVHNMDNNTSANRLGKWISKVEQIHGGNIDAMAFGGDMASASASASNFWVYTQADMDAVAAKGVTGIYTTGNHEYSPGRFSSTSNDTTALYKINTEAQVGNNYRIYCLGSESSSSSYSNQVNSLQSYLNSVGNDKPIFIITHFPLHYYNSYRTTSGASDIIDVLNNAVTNNGQKIAFLWGHNHTEAPGETHYDEIFAPGSEIQFASSSSNKKTIQFYYAAAGCMSDSEYGTGSAAVKGKGLVVTINSKNQLSFTYYDESGNNVTEGGTYTEQDPVAITGLSIDEATEEVGGELVPVELSVETGRSLQLHVTLEPLEATDRTVNWSSSNTAVATVSADGKVKGISEGTATITVTAGAARNTRDIVSASVDITVTQRTTEEQYFIIMIDDYALTSNTSSEMLQNSSGYKYYGLQTASYDSSKPAPYAILWTLEEVDGVENGYYIKSYNGDYLSATYVRNSTGNGYTGTLTVGNIQDIWIVTGGLEAWQGNGSYLQSTNASDNPRPADIYLTYRASNNSIDFFTVGSSSNYKTSKLIEPEEIQQPVAVEGITLDPTSLEVPVNRSSTITATVLPENADDKNVTWTSSDESIATVDANGRVRGVAEGTAVITATTNDGGYTATCTVTVTPSSSPGTGYIITIGDYALSDIDSPDTLVNSGRYYYTGLLGIEYDGSNEATESILWLIEPTNGGYYIMSQDGRYLNATYTANDEGGNNGVLKLDDTPDVWTFEGTLEDWVLSGSTLHSANANKYLTHEEGSTSAPVNLFTVRSTGESSSMIDPDNPAEERFIETNALTNNRDYIIGVNAGGNSVYAIDNASGSGNTTSTTLTVVPSSGDEAAYIVTDKTSVVWRFTSNNNHLANSGSYLTRGGSNNNYVPYAGTSGSAVTYNQNNKRLSISYRVNGRYTTYYLTNSNGTFGLNINANNAAQVRLFEKTTVFNFKYVVQFVNNGVNLYSAKYAEDEIPVYVGATPTRADSELYTYEFIGWSSDGGETVYGPEDTLPAVTGPTTYAAQFRGTPKPQEYTITYELDGGALPEGQSNPESYTNTSDPITLINPTKEGYAFAGWTGTGLDEATEIVTIPTGSTGDRSYTATWTINEYTITWKVEGQEDVTET